MRLHHTHSHFPWSLNREAKCLSVGYSYSNLRDAGIPLMTMTTLMTKSLSCEEGRMFLEGCSPSPLFTELFHLQLQSVQMSEYSCLLLGTLSATVHVCKLWGVYHFQMTEIWMGNETTLNEKRSWFHFGPCCQCSLRENTHVLGIKSWYTFYLVSVGNNSTTIPAYCNWHSLRGN